MSVSRQSERPLVQDVDLPFAFPGVLAAAVLAAALVVFLGRRFNFFFDEWAFVLDAPNWTPTALLVPMNEHLVAAQKVVYWPLFRVFGLRNHLPFLVANATAHALTGIALFALLRRRSGPLPAALLAVVYLFFGRGADDILLSFQLEFVGSVLCGLVAMILLDVEDAGRLRLALAALAMTGSVAFSGNGPFFLGAIFVDLVLDRGRRRYLAVMIVPVVLFGAWFAAVGARASRETITNPYSLSALAALREYVPYGIGAAIAGLFGLSQKWTYLALAVAPAALALRYAHARRFPDSRTIGAAAGLVGMYSVIGSVRYVFGTTEAAESRYVYVAAPFVAIIVADAVRDLRWGGLWRAGIAVAFAGSLVLNTAILFRSAGERNAFFLELENPELSALEAFRYAPGIDTAAHVDLDTMPRVIVGRYFLAMDTFGPAAPPATIDGLGRLPHAAVDKVVANVFGPGVRTSVEDSRAPDTGCANGGPDLSVAVPAGADAVFTSTVAGSAHVYLTLFDTPAVPAAAELDVAAGQPVRVHLPEGGEGVRWHVRVELPKAAVGSLCAAAG